MTDLGESFGQARGPHLVPPAAKWLGAAGAIPFVFLAVAGPFLDGALRADASFALAAYGAVILSFLGGVHWGLAIAGSGPRANQEALLRPLTVSVVPSLIAWFALFLPTAAGLLVLAGAFAVMLLVDLLASRSGQAPAWYPTLRWPLTIAVAASLMLGAAA